MHLEIITPDKKVYEGDVTLIQLPGSKGGFEILKKPCSNNFNTREGSFEDKGNQRWRAGI